MIGVAGITAHPRSVDIDSLSARAVPAEDILNHDGSLIVSSGTNLFPAMLEKPVNFRLLKAIGDSLPVRPA